MSGSSPRRTGTHPMTPQEAHAKAVEAAKAEFLRVWRTERGPMGENVADVSGVIRAYLASLRETVGAGVYVVPGDLGDPVDDGRVTANQWLDMLAYQEGHNAALATVRAARIAIAEPPADG
jgi:hypothetical protein